MVNAHTLQQKYKSWEFSAETTQSARPKPTVQQWEVMTLTCATKIPELGIFWTGRQTNCKTCLETFMIVFFSSNHCIFVCWKFRCTKYTQIVWANMSGSRALTYGSHAWVDHRLGAFPSNNPPWRVQPPSVVGRIYLSAIKHTCKHNMYQLSYSLVKGTPIFYVNPKQRKSI